MASSSAAGTGEDLKRYMEILSDVRRSAVIVCDSIRISELDGGQITQPEQSTAADDAPRCPICTFEYDDPTVVLSGCGHGMHSACIDGFMGTVRTNNNQNADQEFACPLCRLPFRKKDVVLLRSVVPSKSCAIAWRTVQLTSLWEAGAPSNAPLSAAGGSGNTTRAFRELVEQLYIDIRATFRNANDLSYAIGGAVERYNEATKALVEVRKNAEEEKRNFTVMEKRVRKELEVKRKAIEDREKKLIRAESQNHSFLTHCLRAVKREEWKQLKGNASMDRFQWNMQSTLSQLGRTQTQLENARRELELGYRVGTGGASARAEEGPVAADNPVGGGNAVIPITRRGLEVIGIEDSSGSGDENRDRQEPIREGGNGGNGAGSSQRRGGKRLRRNFRIE